MRPYLHFTPDRFPEAEILIQYFDFIKYYEMTPEDKQRIYREAGHFLPHISAWGLQIIIN
jgi:hypothetical protein